MRKSQGLKKNLRVKKKAIRVIERIIKERKRETLRILETSILKFH
jgi:hypothetical protein